MKAYKGEDYFYTTDSCMCLELCSKIDHKHIPKKKQKSYLSYYPADIKAHFNEHRFKQFLINKVKYLLNDYNCIAGGYLLGLAMEYFKYGESKARDIDIFEHCDIQDKTKHVKKFLNQNKNNDLYKFFHKGENYELIHQEKEDKINKIYILASDSFKWSTLIEDFDLNCVKIAIYKEKHKVKVYLSPEFIDFLNTKNIYITSSSRFNSLARAIRKKEQYPMLNFDQSFFHKQILIKNSQAFNRETIDLKEEYTSKENIAILKNITNPLWSITNNNINISFPQEQKKIYDFFHQYFIDKNISLLKKSLLPRYEHYLKIVERYSSKQKSHKKTRVRTFILNLIYYNNFLEKDIKIKEFESLLIFIQHHQLFSNIASFSLKNNYNYSELLKLVKILKSSDDLLAFFESRSFIDFSKANKIYQSYHTFVSAKNNYEYKALDTLLWFNKYITELSSHEMLINESKKMNHCVRGYWSRVARGDERIFHINIKGQHSTFSISKLNKVIQHKAYHNKKPQSLNISLAHMFARNIAYIKELNKV